VQSSVHLQPEAASVPQARRFARSALRTWELGELDDVVSLLVSELVTNAVLHARTAISLVLLRDRESVRVEVSDTSASAPVQQHFSEQAGTGRGLHLVEMLASSWGIDGPSAQGKTVWAEIDVPSQR
jgi:anti-sigma regulatory factor (Ser/Thr protein kinase)